MAGIAPRKAAHEYVKLVASLAPVAGTGSAQNGAAVDRLGYIGAIGVLLWTTSGGVTGGTIVAKFQDSTDGSTGWADYGTAVTVTIPAGPNATGAAEVPADLTGAKRYVRLVVDSDPSGGTPASIVGAAVALAGPDQLPAA
jgi:hypothetical protein